MKTTTLFQDEKFMVNYVAGKVCFYDKKTSNFSIVPRDTFEKVAESMGLVKFSDVLKVL